MTIKGGYCLLHHHLPTTSVTTVEQSRNNRQLEEQPNGGDYEDDERGVEGGYSSLAAWLRTAVAIILLFQTRIDLAHVNASCPANS